MFNSPYSLSWSSARSCKKAAVFAFFLLGSDCFGGAAVAKTSLSVFLRTLFLAVGAPTNGLLFLARRLGVGGRLSRRGGSPGYVQPSFVARCEIVALTRTGRTTGSVQLPRNGNLPLLSSLTHFAARLFSVRTGGFCEVRQTGNAPPGGVRGRRGAGCGVILFVLVQMVTSSGIPLFGWCVGGSVVQ